MGSHPLTHLGGQFSRDHLQGIDKVFGDDLRGWFRRWDLSEDSVHQINDDLWLSWLGQYILHSDSLRQRAGLARLVRSRVENDRCTVKFRIFAQSTDKFIAIHHRH